MEAGALFEAFVAGSGSVVLIELDGAGQVVACSGAARPLLGREPSALLGARLADLLAAADASALEMRMCGDARPSERFLLNFLDAGGRPVTLECHLDASAAGWTLVGEPPRRQDQALQTQLLELNNELATLMRENSRKGRELQRALDELKRAQAMLVHQEKLASLGRVTAGVAHEINNPLAFVISNQTTLQRDFDDVMRVLDLLGDGVEELRAGCPGLAERVREVSEEIDLPYLCQGFRAKITHNLEGLRRIKEIVADLRRFSRLDESSMQHCSLEDGLRATIRFLEPLLDERKVRIEAVIPTLPPITCNPSHINQAVDIVLTNAVLASRPGQEVRLQARQEGDDQIVEVSDQGEGIAPENLGKVFEPFFTTRPVGSGMGLGLSIAHQVVTEHRGRIDIESTLGHGTRVRISLPTRAAESALAPSRP